MNFNLLISDYILLILVFLIGYNYFLYPVVLFVLSKIFKNINEKDKNFTPSVTVIIAAHNEEELIEGAVLSVISSEYPLDKIRIVVGSDGSTDSTNDILVKLKAKYPNNLNFFIFDRIGKNRLINSIIPNIETDFIIFMDADCRMLKSTMKEMMKNFIDNEVGCVIASQSVAGKDDIENAGRLGDTLYHRYEENIRIFEGIIHSNVNSLGYLYAVSKRYLKPIADDFVCDDLFNVYSILEKHRRVVFEKNAKAVEIRKKSFNNELHRRVRAVAGGIATVISYKNLLNIFKYGWVSFFIISHKIFRWVTPVFLLLLMFATFIFWDTSIIWMLVFLLQLILYLMAFIGWSSEKLKLNIKTAKIFLFFVSMNFSSLLGTFRYLKKSQNAVWDRSGFNQEKS